MNAVRKKNGPRLGHFLRDEGHSRRCSPFESVAAYVIEDVHRIHAAFLAHQVPTSGRRKTVAKTDSSVGRPGAIFTPPVCRGSHVASPLERVAQSPFEYNGRLLRVTNHDFFSDSDAASRRDRFMK